MQRDQGEIRANESLFVQELFFKALNALSMVEETLAGSEPETEALPKEAKEKEGDKGEKKNTKGRDDGNKQAKTKGDAQRTKKEHQEVIKQHKNEKSICNKDCAPDEMKVAESDVSGGSFEQPRLNSDSILSGVHADIVPSKGVAESNESESISATIPSEIKLSGSDNQHVDDSEGRHLDLNNHSDSTVQQPVQNNYGARPKDRSFNAASRNSFGSAATVDLPARKPDARRASSGFMSSSSKASSSSSSLLSSRREVPNGRKRSGKNSSAVSSSSNLSDFSSPSAGLSPATNSGLLIDEADGGNGSEGVLPVPPHFQVRQVRNDNHPPGKVAMKSTSQVTNGPPKKHRTTSISSASQMQAGNPTGTKNPSLVNNRGFAQQQNQQRPSRQIGSAQLPPLKPGRTSVGGSGSSTHQNNPGNNSNATNQAAVSIPGPGVGSSSGTNGLAASETSRNNKSSCNSTRNKSILSQKDKTSFR